MAGNIETDMAEGMQRNTVHVKIEIDGKEDLEDVMKMAKNLEASLERASTLLQKLAPRE